MNGWTPSVSLETRVSNLFAQIPKEHHALAAKTCYGTDDYDFERKLTSYVICKGWEHPADVAYDLEAVTEAEQVADEVKRDNQWLTSERDDSYSIPLSDIERHNAKVKKDIFTHDPNCEHEKAFPTYGGMMCRHCGTKFEARNDFEQRLVNARNPKGNGYVNWQFR